jgi:uncharacterized protein YkwD
MKLLTLLFFTLSFLVAANEPELKKEGGKEAFVLLNQVRKNPQAFKTQFPFLAGMPAKPTLVWNDTLARLAEIKAMDMARLNYFAHVDPDGFGMNYYINKGGYKLKAEWLNKPGANYFESCNAGALSGRQAIEMLLIDEGVPSLGHRKHLLGIDEWSATLMDIGIGYVKTNGNTHYSSYTCILIAKHS